MTIHLKKREAQWLTLTLDEDGNTIFDDLFEVRSSADTRVAQLEDLTGHSAVAVPVWVSARKTHVSEVDDV